MSALDAGTSRVSRPELFGRLPPAGPYTTFRRSPLWASTIQVRDRSGSNTVHAYPAIGEKHLPVGACRRQVRFGKCITESN